MSIIICTKIAKYIGCDIYNFNWKSIQNLIILLQRHLKLRDTIFESVVTHKAFEIGKVLLIRHIKDSVSGIELSCGISYKQSLD